MSEKPTLEELLEFPNTFTFRVVAAHREDLQGEVREMVERLLDRPAVHVSCQPSSKGAFMSIRVSVVVTTAHEIRSVYAELNTIDGLRMLL
jgi:putative lipoic acid-binding regulatory protein